MRYELSGSPPAHYPLERVEARFDYLRNVKQVPVQLLGLDKVLRFGDRTLLSKIWLLTGIFEHFVHLRRILQAGGSSWCWKTNKQRAPKGSRQLSSQ
jgi:hypothetical protein